MTPQEPQNLIDINTCSRKDLLSLKGIGPETADHIIEGRPYGKIEDLDRVEDIGPKTLEVIRSRLTVSLIEHVNIPNLVSPREDASEPEMDSREVGVNVNTCTLEALLSVPKVGAHLVARIIDGRPYGRARDLLRVDGISESKLEIIRPYLTVGPDKAWRSVDDPPPKKPKKAKPPVKKKASLPPPAASPPPLSEDKEDSMKEKTPDKITEEKQDKEAAVTVIHEKETPSNHRNIWIMGILSVLLAVLLTLGIIWLINGSLRHATLDDLQERVEELDVGSDSLETAVDDLTTENDDLEERVAALEEALTSANEELEETTDLVETLQALQDKDVDLQEQIDALEARVTTLEEKVTDLEGQLLALQTAGGNFTAPSPNE
jgi:DNA uptake protein ComE-like DNA-binding protein/cell division protein FtsB